MLWKIVLLFSTFTGMVHSRSRARSHLSLWIDQDQVATLIGYPMQIPIIADGIVIPYLKEPGLSDSIVILPEVDTVNLTWMAGEEQFSYWFENLTSLDPHLLYNPLLSIPAHGWIPRMETVFQMSIPCTGKNKGIASLVLGLNIYNRRRLPIEGTPISFTLKKQCTAFAMCNPSCQNNGTCVSPEVCACPPGYLGKHCEKEVCGRPCQNGGRCLPEGYCHCLQGFYGDACEYNYCVPLCKNNGVCVGPNRCNCISGYTGSLCEHSLIKTDTDRPRRSKEHGDGDSERSLKLPKRKKKRNPSRRKRKGTKDLEKKLLKTERRIVKIINRKSKEWTLTREERRVVKKLIRESKARLLSLKEKNYLAKIVTRERDKLTSKEKQKLKRFKKLLKLTRRRNGKPKKRRLFV
ncbi:wnt inhibitory factor 1-like isoform X2 [Gigantopelta aegis]|uniref:wnt inhibitory factor 1-like isoform X2 n=1 Tax=Gigantopelta aegis TaxID=1735272 RepID=UPI001B88C666|nr:wnt inhibitory factor 1-like isoform X2 [Gigantopelta aegis]